MPLLSVNDLKIHFHTRLGIIKAVDGISYTLEAGKTLGIVGESGSGKSVSCYSLLGLLASPPAKIESGTALYQEQDLLKCTNEQLNKIRGAKISMIFQDPMSSLNPYMTIGSQLIEPLLLHQKLPRKIAKQQAIAALESVSINNPKQRLKQYPHELSGGQRQRVMIAMALITKPDILIADEPTTALDATIQIQILELIKQLQKQHNTAVIFITHDLNVIANIADTVLVMHQGKAVESGKTTDIFQNPQNTYTQKLLNAVDYDNKKPLSTGSDTALLKINHLKKYYTQKTWLNQYFNKKAITTKAVDDISLNINRGEILALVGESGSGKSTLGRAIMQLISTTTGSIQLGHLELNKLDASALREIRPRLQMIFQDPYASLDPRMTVFDIIAEPLIEYPIKSGNNIDTQVTKLLKNVGLSSQDMLKYPHEFSGGQRQRIAIARAIALKPELLIADEPISALDATIQTEILELLLQLKTQYQLTILFITHDLNVVRYIADRVAVMHQGQIVELNQTEQLFDKPQHDYTKTLLASILPFPTTTHQN